MPNGFNCKEKRIDNLMSSQEIDQLLSSWGLSEQAIAVLAKEPEIVADIAEARELEPFDADYQPRVFEVLFDDVVHIRREKGKPPYITQCPEGYQPSFTEFAFDEQTALFLVNGEVVVNRAEKMRLKVADFLNGVDYADGSSKSSKFQ